MLSKNFGTHRGFIRLALSYIELGFGQAKIAAPQTSQVKRLVFVCHGNICRSAFADVYAREIEINSASFGLSTASGKQAYPLAVKASKDAGIDLTDHRTTRVEDYQPKAGDFLLAMETRQLRKIATDPKLAGLPRDLLGKYSRPFFPHLHDPYELNPDYMPICLSRIRSAVDQLKVTFPAASIG